MITAAELPLSPRGAVYHLNILPEELADIVITVGDPARVSFISAYFDSVETICSHREFLTHTGYIGRQRISVLSTGIGIPNIDIAINELDAIANIDLKTRKIKDQKKSLKIIRLGTTGGLSSHCNPGEIVMSQYAVGFDTLMDYYQYQPSAELIQLKQQLINHLNGSSGPFYVSESSKELLSVFESLGKKGITATAGGFYGPQGRTLRIPLRYNHLLTQMGQFSFNNLPLINLEMETAAIYALASQLGHQAISLSVVVANREQGTFVHDVTEVMRPFIEKALAIIEQLPKPRPS